MSTKPKHETREAWLVAAQVHIRERIDAAAETLHAAGAFDRKERKKGGKVIREAKNLAKAPRVPDVVRISVGWPVTGGLSRKSRTIGQFFHPEAAKDKIGQIFISPVLGSTALEVLECATHEHVHACVEASIPGSKHKAPFQKLAAGVGLLPPWTVTKPGEDFKKWAADVEKALGPFPHGVLDPRKEHKPKGSALFVCSCPKHPEQKARLTSREVREFGTPLCPVDGCGKAYDAPDEATEGGEE